jgi:hypothetical protein
VNVSLKPPTTLKQTEKRRDIVSSMGKQIESLKETYDQLVTQDLNESDPEQMTLFSYRRKRTIHQNDSDRDTSKNDWLKKS